MMAFRFANKRHSPILNQSKASGISELSPAPASELTPDYDWSEPDNKIVTFYYFSSQPALLRMKFCSELFTIYLDNKCAVQLNLNIILRFISTLHLSIL